MNGLVVKEAFFLILSAIFAVTVLVVLGVTDTASNSPPEGFDKIWSTFNQFKGAAASGFVAIGAFLWLFSTFLWRFKWFYPWLVMHRDISGTWFAESIPGVWNTFTTLMHVDHGFFRISVVLLRP